MDVGSSKARDYDLPQKLEGEPMNPMFQGDVGIQPVAAIPENCKPIARDNGRVILAYGEVTGHAHAILAKDAELVISDTNEQFLKIMATCELKHEEHATITLEPGFYRVIQQREYVSADMAPIPVAD